MEASSTVLQQVTYITGSGTNNRSLSGQSISNCGSLAFGGGARIRGAARGVSTCARTRMASGMMGSGFSDSGHLQYYQAWTTRCGGKDKQKGSAVLTTKKKMKLLKGLTKGLSMFSDLGLALDPENRNNLLGEVQEKINTDAAEVLLKQLEQLRAEEKEIKRKKKQEKAKLKAGRMKTESSSSSSSESSDSDCGEVVNMNNLRTCVAPAKVNELQLKLPVEDTPMLIVPTLPWESQTRIEKTCEDHNAYDHDNDNVVDICHSFKDESNVGTAATPKRIEVCMGKKCERSGAAALLQEFEKVMGVEGAVVGCKCMGKCRSAPNVRVKTSAGDGIADADGVNDSLKVSANPLCIGVGLEDVATIVANFLGEGKSHSNMGLPAPTNS